MNCNKCKQMLLSYLDNELNPLEIVSLEDHLSTCPGCREELEALVQTQGELRQAFKSMTAGLSPSPNALAHIRQRIATGNGHSAGILSRWKEKLQGGKGMFKSPNFRWQIAGTLIAGVLLVVSLAIPAWSSESPGSTAAASGLTKFSSYDELKEYIEESSQPYYHDKSNLTYGSSSDGELSGPVSMGALDAAEDGDTRDYSETNVQVEGVDEADIVKTDGEFIYLVSDGKIIIAKAYPASDAQVIAEIDMEENINITGLFINNERLVVIYQNWNNGFVSYEYDDIEDKLYLPESTEILPPQTHMEVYDVSDRENPFLTRDMSIDGDYFNSRMIGDYIYLIINASAYEQDDKIELPVIHQDTSNTEDDIEIQATDIYYTDIADYYYSFTTIVAVNIEKDGQVPEYETLLLGNTSNLYVSLDNIYIASTVWSDNSEKTAIHRIHTSGGDIEYEASGEAPGRLLNQFSMDEYGGFFRVATTTSGWAWGGIRLETSSPDALEDTSDTIIENTSANHLYVLDMDLNIVGKVENLAPGEQIYSTRFMGDKAYMVTFRQVDPLFVIDLTDPSDPEVLGQLKITGYSDYLQPYDENHLVGIGKEASTDGLFLGVKISLFDVSDFDNPKEIDKYIIGERGSESPVLYDHKALLFDKSRNLMVMPVLVCEGSYYYYSWQGAYVFDISVDGDDSLILRGTITHLENDGALNNIYSQSDSFVERSLYIDGVLYTISNAKIEMNDLETLEEIGEIVLP